MGTLKKKKLGILITNNSGMDLVELQRQKLIDNTKKNNVEVVDNNKIPINKKNLEDIKIVFEKIKSS